MSLILPNPASEEHHFHSPHQLSLSTSLYSTQRIPPLKNSATHIYVLVWRLVSHCGSFAIAMWNYLFRRVQTWYQPPYIPACLKTRHCGFMWNTCTFLLPTWFFWQANMNGFSSSRWNESMEKMDRIKMAENDVNHCYKSNDFILSSNYFSFLRNEARCRESTLAI